MDITKYEVPADRLYWHCDPSIFDFNTTKDLAPLGEFIGQDRAIRAIEFGLSMNRDGYNIYVAGLTGTGKTSVVKSYIKKLAEKRKTELQYHPEDWCYLYNYADPDHPQVLNLPHGMGKVFKDQISNLLLGLKEELAKAFSSEEYKAQRKRTVEESRAAQQKLLQEINEEAQRQGFLFEMATTGVMLYPLADGKPLSQADYLALAETEQKELEAKRSDLLKKLKAVLERVHEIEKQTGEKLQSTDKAIADFTVSRFLDYLLREYKDLPKVIQYLADLKNYTLSNLSIFKESEEPAPPAMGVPISYATHWRDPFLPFQVNVFVDNSTTEGPPIIIESNPTYSNLLGKIERRFLLGGYLSDHTMLKPGALHLANGGYLLLSTNEVLSNPGVWQALKRAIKTKEARIEDLLEQFGHIAPQGLRPQPIPISVKVILIGDSLLYQLLSIRDEDFWETFRVKADFDFQVERSQDNLMAFAAFIAGCCEEGELHHFDTTGVARVAEFAARMVANQEKLSSRFAQVKELVEEAEYWACQDGASVVSAQHVERAIEERHFRHNLPDERIRELINRGTIMIDTQGEVVGQVNGLSTYNLGDITFGKPSRITCKTFLGRGGVINIERESQLSGRIHDKGVLILSGYMGWKYAQDNPLSLSASLCFEQSYEGVEGDSASSAELYALLSSLSGLGIKQNIAVTGSVNQKGELQPVGGINEKVEGFFKVCQANGLTADQGILMPHHNLSNLMLRQEVVEAVRQGKFHIYAVNTIDEGIEILTGVEAAKRGEDGTYPEGTVNYKVDQKLKEMAAKLKQFYAPGEEKK
ncbi:MAG: Lon protease family protein [Dehalococcoidia bacterium]|nr:Lon protease 1 [Chloroflexota bacterium]MBT9161616.1 Lon protease 1 [Chloroflexota bacterium]